MNDLLTKISLFQELEPHEREALSHRLTIRHFPKNTFVILDGDHSDSLYIILEGKIKVFLSDDTGKEVILNYQGPGEYFGEMSLLDELPRSASVVTLKSSKIAVLSKQDFMHCIVEHPNIAMSIIKHLSIRLRTLTEKVKNLALMDVYGRVTHTLLDLSEPQDGGRVVKEPLTQQELANLVGASREMVTRILKDLTTGGYINIKNKQITIKEKLPLHW